MKTFKLLFGLILCGLILAMSSCLDQQTIDELAKFKQVETLKTTNIELVKKFYRHLDALQLDSLMALGAPDLKVYYQSGEPGSLSDMVPFVEMFYAAFPDYKHDIDGIIAAGDKVVVRVAFSGTFTNSFMGLSPSGEKFKYKGVQIFQFTNGKMNNFWVVEDELALMTQLGLELKPITSAEN